MSDLPVVIYHNPNCTTSCKTLAILKERGLQPTVVEYLKTGWTRPLLKDLLGKLGMSARELMRVRGTPAEDLGLTKPGVPENKILDAMITHPILVERPIVVTSKGARLARPQEKVLEIL